MSDIGSIIIIVIVFRIIFLVLGAWWKGDRIDGTTLGVTDSSLAEPHYSSSMSSGHQNCCSSWMMSSQSCMVNVPSPLIMMVMVMSL